MWLVRERYPAVAPGKRGRRTSPRTWEGLFVACVVLLAAPETARGASGFNNGTLITEDVSATKAVYAADMDGDGDLDILSASFTDNRIAWYQNLDGLGTFGPQTRISSTTNGARSVSAADLDGDGDLDVLACSFDDDQVIWFENMDGNGTFSTPINITDNVWYVEWTLAADIDGDDDLDVVAASMGDRQAVWFENDGVGNFAFFGAINTADLHGLEMVSVADIDDDGDLDVLSASGTDDRIVWFANDGSGTFAEGIDISAGADGANFVTAADLDGDDDLDVVSSSGIDNRIVWYENLDSLGTFGPGVEISADLVRPISVVAADLDEDGDFDLVVASSLDDRVVWFENEDGKGTFSGVKEVVADINDVRHVIAADLDGDGDLDLVAGALTEVYWYENGAVNTTAGDVVPSDDDDLVGSAPGSTPSPAAPTSSATPTADAPVTPSSSAESPSPESSDAPTTPTDSPSTETAPTDGTLEPGATPSPAAADGSTPGEPSSGNAQPSATEDNSAPATDQDEPTSTNSEGSEDNQALDAVWEIVITVLGSVSAGVIMLVVTKRYHDSRHPDPDAPPPPPPPGSTFSHASNGPLGDSNVVNGVDGVNGNGGNRNGGVSSFDNQKRAVV